MSEEGKGFVIKDKRSLNEKGELKEEGQEEIKREEKKEEKKEEEEKKPEEAAAGLSALFG